MGCDIHSMVEVKRQRYEGRREFVPGLPWTIGAGSTRWVALTSEDYGIFPNNYYDPDSSYAPFRQKLRAAPLDDRNYTLFALLADVRNGRGFAGIVTGDRITPLAEPRGVPKDASYEWLAECDSWDVDMHSHTWFTLAELIDHPLYTQRLVRTGAITGAQYERIKREGGTPDGWSGSVSGPGIRTVTVDEYDAGERGERSTYVQHVWEDSLLDSISELMDAIAALKRYAADLPPAGMLDHEGKPVDDVPGWYGHGAIPYEDIRIVCGFDN